MRPDQPIPPPLAPQASTSNGTLYMPVQPPPTPAPSPRLRPASPSTSTFPILNPALLSPTSPTTGFSFSTPAPAPLLSPTAFIQLSPHARLAYLTSLLSVCTPAELLAVQTHVAPRLKRDFLRELPPELALYVLGHVDDPRTLARVGQVSRTWRALAQDDALWRTLCARFGFDRTAHYPDAAEADDQEERALMRRRYHAPPPANAHPAAVRRVSSFSAIGIGAEGGSASPGSFSPRMHFSYRALFQYAYETLKNWRHGGTCLRTHRVPVLNPDSGVVTSVAMDGDWLVAGLANHRIHVFSARSGLLVRTLVGHELGVWAVNLVSRGGVWRGPYEAGVGMNASMSGSGNGGGASVSELRDTLESVLRHNRAPAGAGMPDPQGLDGLISPMMRTALGLDMPRRYAPPHTPDGDEDKEKANVAEEAERARVKQMDACGASEGWGQPGPLVVSGGCDKVLRVWDLKTGHCIYVLQGHTSTVRCLKVLHNRPIAVSGSRDATLRVWDVQRGKMLRVLRGHTQSIRALAVYGNRVVTGSYDCTCRLWDVDTGECLQVFRGHFHQIYSVAYDGVRIASGGLDTTVRLWDARTGACLALLQGHTALVCQLQLSPTLLATGGADGRVITFALPSYAVQHRIAAHDSSVTSLQFDDQFLVTGGNDGRVRLFDLHVAEGNYVRDLSEACEVVWKVVFRREGCAVLCKRAGKTVVEIWSFRPRGGE